MDNDFYADAGGSALLRSALSAAFATVDVRESATGWGAICGGSVMVDVLNADPVAAAILACSDNEPGEHLGVPLSVISEATQLAIKLGYRGLGPHASKNERDILWWSSRVQLQPEHEAVRAAMAAKASTLWPSPSATGSGVP